MTTFPFLFVNTENCPPPCTHAFQRTRTIFELSRDVITTTILTKFNEYWTINIHYSHIWKTSTPAGDIVFQRTRTVIELSQDIIKNFADQVLCTLDYTYDF
ncbi:hypothetical protein DPMN_157011 [Dreissena polymorpha]|uniref:Uncharacterized protein n=1 Tax=Dreissena polymorpha TaxID=45954 RepID=A0A9D4FRP6_DREPO|nr:hypothetical protein DPMN_157011 [Dreissena polymorpha]